MGRHGADQALIEAILNKHIGAPEVVVEVHRRLGDMLPKREAVAFISAHIGEGQIRVADRRFTSFVVVAHNGVATGWTAHGGAGDADG